MSDESELCDFGQYPEIYADGVGEIQILGVNARVMFFSCRGWRASFDEPLSQPWSDQCHRSAPIST